MLPGLPKAFLHPVKIISPINARHGNGLIASFSCRTLQGLRAPNTASSPGQCCLCRGGPGVWQGTARGALGGEVAGRGLGTSSVPAVSCVPGAHTDLFACACGLMDGELKGRQGLLVASCPPGTAVQAKPVHLSVRSAVGRVGASPTCRHPRTCWAVGGSQRRPKDGAGCWRRF